MTFKTRIKLQRAAMLIVLPPAGVAGLYLYGSSTGCSGGDCTGPMMGVMMIGVLAVPLVVAGVLMLIDIGLTTLGGWVRRRFERERT